MKEKNITEDAKIGKIREMHDFFIIFVSRIPRPKLGRG